jgi:hypothetical protein
MLPAVRATFRLSLSLLPLAPLAGLLFCPGGLGAKAVVALVFAIALARPADGLLVCAGLFVLGSQLRVLLGVPYDLVQPIVLAYLGGWLLHGVIRPRASLGRSARRLVVIAVCFGAVVAISGLVGLRTDMADSVRSSGFRRALVFLVHYYLADPNAYPAAAAAAPLLEGLGLFVALLCLCGERPFLAGRVAAVAAGGATGVAALNVNRFVCIWLRAGGGAQSLVANLRNVRISAVFSDYNAAGSYLAMMLCLMIGLVFAARRLPGRAAWAGCALLLAAALWMTGSRSALPAIPFCLAWLIASALREWLHLAPWKPLAVAVFAGALVVAAAVPYVPNGGTSRPAIDMLRGRAELARAALRMSAAHPVTGVGIGRFFGESSAYISPDYRRTLPRENAHNQYLQILAELGVAGLVPFLWLLAAVGARALEPAFKGPDAVLSGAALGLTVFLLSSVFGHPMVIREVCLAFWILLGVVAALALEARTRGVPGAARSAHRRCAGVGACTGGGAGCGTA